MLNHSSVTDNRAEFSASGAGGGLYNAAGAVVTLRGRAIIADNTALQVGGGILNAGELTIEGRALITGNSAFSGGGVFNRGVLALAGRYRISENTARGKGGGIYAIGDSGIVGSMTGVRNNLPDQCYGLGDLCGAPGTTP
jgi:hypothetical protein